MSTVASRFYYHTEVQQKASVHGLDPLLVEAVCMVESSGDTAARRHEPKFWLRYMANQPQWREHNPKRVATSYGLMQVMYTSALLVGYPPGDAPEFLFVPHIGLEYGCRILKNCFTWAHGDIPATLAAYNGGRTADNGPDRPVKRNQAYVDKVLREYAKLKADV